MLIASISALNPIEHTVVFSNTSFPVTGPSDEFLSEQGYAKVNVFKSHDKSTQKLEVCEPYYEEPWVYTVKVVNKTEDELLDEQKSNRELLQKNIIEKVQIRLDTFAQSRGYDNTNSIAKYKDISDEEISMLPTEEQFLVQKFRTECRYLAVATARTWAKLYLILAEVQSGNRVVYGYSDIENDLPELIWPI